MKLGLIGYPLNHSYSQMYFNDKFKKLNLKEFSYQLFNLKNISEIRNVLKDNELSGFNITSPYKKDIIMYLDELSGVAEIINVVNCVKINKGKLIGFNTDIFGMEKTLKLLNVTKKDNVLIIGNGCSSKVLQYFLKKEGNNFLVVTRNPISSGQISYSKITQQIIENHIVIINTTILGMYPEINNFPPLPYHFINHRHICFDLIYNPIETMFLQKCKNHGATVQNGLLMFETQAEKSFEIWTSEWL